ncbi:hypothetical protein HBI56_005440 [Parastagonospora nodorum]|nr:hypothetical protein HBH53_079590 [Parastagonospora nodorum]KAH4005292.1 hypothetical protein HBI10_033240 [Parastagonospora nodorum]KAH4033080.1 hypothetical protein HBI13_005860 [Parastagonospora nodorum]KAH4060945.1 hypothetical protein HBH49_008670 [Parastagonospora nodorum]KAH4073594.1 hypothetical protein HBH50_056240 [Parastagonospora nodorum]
MTTRKQQPLCHTALQEMDETTTQTQIDRAVLRCTTLFVHVMQLVLAVVVLGLDAYGVCYVAYNILIYSLIISVCTIPVCGYLIIAQTVLRKLYTPYTAGAYHAWMLMFWITDLGLASHLATMWSGHGCAEDFHDSSICVPFEKRDLQDARTKVSYRWYYMMLIAGVVLTACELTLWIVTTSLLVFAWWKRPSTDTEASSVTAPWPGRSHTISPHVNIPFEGTSSENTNYPDVFHIPAPNAPWDQPRSQHQEARHQIIPDASTDGGYSTQTSREIERDPLAGYLYVHSGMAPDRRLMRAKSLNRSIYGQPSMYRTSADERSGPPSDTQQIDWSERSSLGMMNPSLRSSMSTGRRVRRFTMGE